MKFVFLFMLSLLFANTSFAGFKIKFCGVSVSHNNNGKPPVVNVKPKAVVQAAAITVATVTTGPIGGAIVGGLCGTGDQVCHDVKHGEKINIKKAATKGAVGAVAGYTAGTLGTMASGATAGAGAVASGIATGATVGATSSCVRSTGNQLIDDGKVDFKKVGKDTLIGGVVGGLVGGICGASGVNIDETPKFGPNINTPSITSAGISGAGGGALASLTIGDKNKDEKISFETDNGPVNAPSSQELAFQEAYSQIKNEELNNFVTSFKMYDEKSNLYESIENYRLSLNFEENTKCSKNGTCCITYTEELGGKIKREIIEAQFENLASTDKSLSYLQQKLDSLPDIEKEAFSKDILGIEDTYPEDWAGYAALTKIAIFYGPKIIKQLAIYAAKNGEILLPQLGQIVKGSTYLIENTKNIFLSASKYGLKSEGEVLATNQFLKKVLGNDIGSIGYIEQKLATNHAILKGWRKNHKILDVLKAETVNLEMLTKYNYTEVPFQLKTLVIEFTPRQTEKFVRVIGPKSASQGRWIMRKDAIKGLTPKQVMKKFSLEVEPTHLVEVKVSSGARLARGKVAENFGGNEGAVQYLIRDAEFSNFSFSDAVKIEGVIK